MFIIFVFLNLFFLFVISLLYMVLPASIIQRIIVAIANRRGQPNKPDQSEHDRRYTIFYGMAIMSYICGWVYLEENCTTGEYLFLFGHLLLGIAIILTIALELYYSKRSTKTDDDG